MKRVRTRFGLFQIRVKLRPILSKEGRCPKTRSPVCTQSYMATYSAWDGTVETVAEGPFSALEKFEAYLHRGPSAAYVESVDVTYGEATGEFRAFNIRY